MKSFRQKGGLLHGWGTLHGTGETPCAAWLAVGDERKIPALLGRTDSSPQGGKVSVDFVLYGTLADINSQQDSLLMVLEWRDARRLRLPLAAPREAPAGRGFARIMAMPWKHYFSRGWRLLRQGQAGLLLRKLAGMTAATITSGWHPARLLVWAAAQGRPLALVIDHDLGGGANLYRRSLLSRLAADGYVPLLLSAHHGILAYQLTARRNGRNRSAHVDDPPDLFGYLSQANIQRVVFNNILSFPAPLAMVKGLSDWLRQRRPAQFLFLVHDYYSICPVWLLLDDKGRYCGIPDTTVCASCLRTNASPFLKFSAGVDIAGWRSAWGGLLRQANEIRCFSESSRRLMLKAYPAIDERKITVVPHSLSHLHLRRVRLADPGWPVVGIVGHIAHHKGSKVVRELAKHIITSGSRARLVIVGTIDEALPASVATVTGPYSAQELPDIIERHGVNLALFPSICPETFSFVVAELVEMGMPVLCFDLGAPAERVAGYEKGMVIESTRPDSVLRGLEQLYLEHVKLPSTKE